MIVVDTALSGINYKLSFKGYLITANVTENWGAFLKITAKTNLMDFQIP